MLNLAELPAAIREGLTIDDLAGVVRAKEAATCYQCDSPYYPEIKETDGRIYSTAYCPPCRIFPQKFKYLEEVRRDVITRTLASGEVQHLCPDCREWYTKRANATKRCDGCNIKKRKEQSRANNWKQWRKKKSQRLLCAG